MTVRLAGAALVGSAIWLCAGCAASHPRESDAGRDEAPPPDAGCWASCDFETTFASGTVRIDRDIFSVEHAIVHVIRGGTARFRIDLLGGDECLAPADTLLSLYLDASSGAGPDPAIGANAMNVEVLGMLVPGRMDVTASEPPPPGRPGGRLAARIASIDDFVTSFDLAIDVSRCVEEWRP